MEPSSELIEGGIYVALTATKPASEGIKEKKLSWKIAVATSGQTAFVYGVAPCDRSKPGSSNKWSMTNAAEVNIIDISGLCVLYRIGNASYLRAFLCADETKAPFLTPSLPGQASREFRPYCQNARLTSSRVPFRRLPYGSV